MDFLQKHKTGIFISIVVLLIIVIFITNNSEEPNVVNTTVGYIVTPLQKIAVNIEDWTSSKIDSIKSRDEMILENKRLREENDILKMQANKIDMIVEENENYKQLLELSGKYPNLNVVGAEVSGYDSNNWSQIFDIDKGSKDGIKLNMVVLSGGGLCGKITKVGYNYAQVTPIIDDTISVGVQTKKGGEYGFVKGDLKLSEQGYCLMENIDIDADILVNDEIITSNIGHIYPPGVIVGIVAEVHEDSAGLKKYAYIKPVAKFQDLKSVLVVTDIFEREKIDKPPIDLP